MKLHMRTTFNADQARITVTAVKARGANLRPWLDDVADLAAKTQMANFLTQGSLAGGWAPLSPKYGLWKSTHEAGRPMMVSTGNLMASVTQKSRLVQRMTGKSVRISSDVHYAEFHQSGTSRMPQRKVIVLPDSVVDLMKRKLMAYVLKGKIV